MSESPYLKSTLFPSTYLISLVEEFVDSDHPHLEDYQTVTNLVRGNLEVLEQAMDELKEVYAQVHELEEMIQTRMTLAQEKKKRQLESQKEKLAKAEEKFLAKEVEWTIDL